jgi:uncharacterized damage-inducible protein DinB
VGGLDGQEGSLKNFKQKENKMELLTLEQFYTHWQGHRQLTIRTLEAFPKDKLFSYNVEPMRPFGEITKELLEVENSTMNGVLSGEWKWEPKYKSVTSKQELLEAFKKLGKQTQESWSKLSSDRLRAVEKDAWGMTWANYERLLYMHDNEIHHRAQGYVYLRLLGIEPPAFYER